MEEPLPFHNNNNNFEKGPIFSGVANYLSCWAFDSSNTVLQKKAAWLSLHHRHPNHHSLSSDYNLLSILERKADMGLPAGSYSDRDKTL